SCANNLKQISLAMHLYESVHRRLPPSALDNEGATWAWIILPYLEQENLYKQWPLGQPFYTADAAVRQTPIPNYFCPSRRSPGPECIGIAFVQAQGCLTDQGLEG